VKSNKMRFKEKYRRRDASALIIVLWVVGLLSMLIGSFAFDAHVESRITSYYRKRTKADYLARSGIEIAEMLMRGSAEIKKDQEKVDEFEDDQWFEDKKRLKTGSAIVGLTQELGDGKIILDIIPEPARRNINMLKDDDWERILEVGGIPEDFWPELIDSFNDWTDKDDNPRMDGGESEDYYETLDPPYRADNDVLDTVEELLLVKGFSKTILFGGSFQVLDEEDPVVISGIADLLTTYGDGKVNVNAAPKRVLLTLPLGDEAELVAQAIIEERNGVGWIDESVGDDEQEDFSFKDVGDFSSRLPDAPAEIRNYISVDSKTYRIKSVGDVHGVKRTVWCIARYADKSLTILRWREEEE
jgi:general secretion pathway protein K